MKHSHDVVLFFTVLLTAKATPQPSPSPSEEYLLHEVLDPNGKYHVFWKFNSSHITFEVHVHTRGYIGFGLSPNGKMYPSDVVVGWVKDGVTHFSDRHTTEHVQPVIDQSQDWTLLHGMENDYVTMLKFQRPLVTCDDNDTDIGPFYFPQNAGLPIGENDTHLGYILEVHYNNSGGIEGLVDNSGFRITYTSKLRQQDAAILAVRTTSTKSVMIPSYYTDFTIRTEISRECLNEVFY